MDVSENNGTPQSSILKRFFNINHPFWGTPILGNLHLDVNMSYGPGGVSWFLSLREAWCNDHSENDDVEDDERPETLSSQPWVHPPKPSSPSKSSHVWYIYISSWWLNQPHLKNMLVKMGSSSPTFGVKIKNI